MMNRFGQRQTANGEWRMANGEPGEWQMSNVVDRLR